jgi:hypothetical protein
MVSRELEKECVVVFDEAHNIDNVCIEALRCAQIDLIERRSGARPPARPPAHPPACSGTASQVGACSLRRLLARDAPSGTAQHSMHSTAQPCNPAPPAPPPPRVRHTVQHTDPPSPPSTSSLFPCPRSVNIRPRTLDGASRNLASLRREIERARTHDATRLRAEYDRLVAGLAAGDALGGGGAAGGAGAGGEDGTIGMLLANPVLPDDVLREAVPGNIRRAGTQRSAAQRSACSGSLVRSCLAAWQYGAAVLARGPPRPAS